MPKIAISYRRADTDVMAGRIRDRLAVHYGEDGVFMDIESIPFGGDFRAHIFDAVVHSDMLLVIVGQRWLGAGRGGNTRIDRDTDVVRIEVEAALHNGVPIIPVLAGAARMPQPAQLPESLKEFAFLNAAPVDTGRDFHQHMERLIRSIDQVLLNRRQSSPASASPDEAAAPTPPADVVPLTGEDAVTLNREFEAAPKSPAVAEHAPSAAESRSEPELQQPPADTLGEPPPAEGGEGVVNNEAAQSRIQSGLAPQPTELPVARMDAMSAADSPTAPPTDTTLHETETEGGDDHNVEGPAPIDAEPLSNGTLEALSPAEAERSAGQQPVSADIEARPSQEQEIAPLRAAPVEGLPGPDSAERSGCSNPSPVAQPRVTLPGAAAAAAPARSGRGARVTASLGIAATLLLVVAGVVIIYLLNRNPLLRTLSGDFGEVTSVAFSPDGRTLASVSSDMTLRLWDVASWRELRTLSGHSDAVNSVAFSPDGRSLASGSGDGTIKLWEVASGRERRTLGEHSGSVISVAFSPDGRTLASGNSDKTIKLWEAASRRELRTLSSHSSEVNSVAFSPDWRTLASGSDDKTIKLWDVANIR